MRVKAAPPSTAVAGVVRVSTFRARAGRSANLVDAAEENARDARAADGCLSADVCTAPGTSDTVLVISRWESGFALGAFLDRHERHAHDAVSRYASTRPRSIHYPVIGRRTPAVLPSAMERSAVSMENGVPEHDTRAGVVTHAKATVCADWRHVLAPQQVGPNVTVLHESTQLKVVLVGLAPGQALPPHPGPAASFHVLSGTGAVVVDGVEHAVSAGATVIVEPGAQRSVSAASPLVFLGNLSDPASEDGPH